MLNNILFYGSWTVLLIVFGYLAFSHKKNS